MRTSVAELWMAGSEQFHRVAVEAASAGVEVGIARLRASRGAVERVFLTGAASLTAGPASAGVCGNDSTRRHRRRQSRDPARRKFVGEHFEIESTGTAPRGARDVQVQGVVVISIEQWVRTFRRIGGGLGAE